MLGFLHLIPIWGISWVYPLSVLGDPEGSVKDRRQEVAYFGCDMGTGSQDKPFEHLGKKEKSQKGSNRNKTKIPHIRTV